MPSRFFGLTRNGTLLDMAMDTVAVGTGATRDERAAPVKERAPTGRAAETKPYMVSALMWTVTVTKA